MPNIIIELPTGGLAVCHHDEIANVMSTTAHDGARVTYPATAKHYALTLCSLVAGPDERDLPTLERVYGTEGVTKPREIEPLRVGESVIDAYREDCDGASFSLELFRDYAKERYDNARGDATWPEFWHAVLMEAVRRGIMRA